MSQRTRLALALAAIAATAAVGWVSVRTTRQQLAAIEACDALARGDIERTLELTESSTRGGETGRAAAECRCRALRARGEAAACSELLGSLARDPDWLPALDLLGAAIEVRARTEPESAVIADLAARLPAQGDLAARGRAQLAQRLLRRNEPRAALQLLGDRPRAAKGEALELWFDTRLHAYASGDDLGGVLRTRSEWLAAGTDAATVRARYALALSIAGLDDPDQGLITLLERSLAETAQRGDQELRAADRRLREGLAIRLVLSLASAARLDEALRAYDQYREELGLEGLRRGELLRAARRERLADLPADARRGRLRFRLAQRLEAAWLLVSPDEGAPVDAPFERIEFPAAGELVVSRSEGEAPVRWVLHRSGGVLASGSVNPRAGEDRNVRIETGGLAMTAPGHVRSRRLGDGHRRVALVLLDCGDWRMLRYLLARGELPVIGALLRDGHRAVLESDPPLTAAALEALVWPGSSADSSMLGLVHRMGVELAGLASVGDNPFSVLRLVLPERDDLFSTIGAGEGSAANLLLSHGGIRAGRHGEVSGPHGAVSRVPIGRAARDLSPDERRRFPALADLESERDRLHLRTIAAEFDVALELARAGEHDLFALRIEPLDILTHASFSDTSADGQDDGRGLLFSVYRYIDARLGAVDAALDEDDLLIVMSDHGIRTAMEHSRDAFFVAVSAGVPAGRSTGRPDLRGVPRVVADWLGVSTDWPDTGVAPFARTVVATATASAEVETPLRSAEAPAAR